MIYLVTVTGRPLSGRDTFSAEACRHLHRLAGFVCGGMSSIAVAKQGYGLMLAHALGVTFNSQNMSQTDRACLSEIKATLDRHHNYTVENARVELLRYMAVSNGAIFYQVEEPDNVRKIKDLENERVVVKSVLVMRHGVAAPPRLPNEPEYNPENFDYAFTTGTLEELRLRALTFAESIIDQHTGRTL